MSLLLLTLSLWLSSISLRVKCDSVCKTPNTGTALFRTIDVHRRHCWSREELALLYTRRALVDLVPKQIPHNVPLILELTQICLTTLREMTSTSPRVYDYMSAALADTLGGYLQSYGLPLLHEAYYEGYVSYDNAAELHRIQEHFKALLTTDGGGWTRPMVVRKQLNRVLPLKVPTAATSKPCALLLTDTAPSCQKPPPDELSAFRNQTNSIIPLPILDDNKHPNSIAIPFRHRALFNLKSRNSYDVLIKYYVEASKCISQAQKTGLEQSEFDLVFSNWLKTKIIPHLSNEDWYIGFSNVLRIDETIQQRTGMISAKHGTDKPEESLFSELISETQMSQGMMIAIAVIAAVSLLLLCCLYWAFIKTFIMCCAKVEIESSSGESEGDISDNTSLLGAEGYNSEAPHGNGLFRSCAHRNQSKNSELQELQNNESPRTNSEESRFTLSCGLGKGLKCRKGKR